jgi:multidrug efflux pump
LSVYSPDARYTSTYVDNYTNLYVLDELKRVPGANRASVIGMPDIAMRVWLRPDRMAQLGITVREVSNALQSQNQTFGIGQIGGQPSVPGTQQTFVITAQGCSRDRRSSRTSSSARTRRRGHGAPARHRPRRARQARTTRW